MKPLGISRVYDHRTSPQSAGHRPALPRGHYKTRTQVRCRVLRDQCFNPLPSPKQGETSSNEATLKSGSRFNPLPSPKQGETAQPQPHGRPGVVSIRSPRRSKGRRLVGVHIQLFVVVSIRSPRRSKGRLLGGWYPRRCCIVSIRSPRRSKGRHHKRRLSKGSWWFQSAPLAEARGDT